MCRHLLCSNWLGEADLTYRGFGFRQLGHYRYPGFCFCFVIKNDAQSETQLCQLTMRMISHRFEDDKHLESKYPLQISLQGLSEINTTASFYFIHLIIELQHWHWMPNKNINVKMLYQYFNQAIPVKCSKMELLSHQQVNNATYKVRDTLAEWYF